MLFSGRASRYRSFNGEPPSRQDIGVGPKIVSWWGVREKVRTLSMHPFNLANVQLSSQIKTIIQSHVYGKCEIQMTTSSSWMMLRWIFCWKMYINLWAFAIRHKIIINFSINLLGKALQTLILSSSVKILWLPQISLWFLSNLSLLQRFRARLLSKAIFFPKKVNSLGNMMQGQALISQVYKLQR